MTQYNPTLIVKRVVIERGDGAVYDEKFHSGVNVIRGQNSSGKSTIMNFITYGLGGDLTEVDWSEHAKLCNRVLIEVEFDGKIAMLSREVSLQRGQPMEIFGGDFDAAKAAARDEWNRYPYNRSPSKESFSQAVFRLLHLPEVASEASGRLTIHQILRLLYADQMSPVETLFRSEPQYDSPLIREAVGRLLCGAYDSSLYQNELRIRELQKEFDSVSGELRSLFAVIGQTGESATAEWNDARRLALEEQRRELQAEIEKAEQELYTRRADDELTLKAQERAYVEVQLLQGELGDVRQKRDQLTLEMADSASFISSLENKIKALNDSSTVANYLGDVLFQYCPACYSPVSEGDVNEHACHLCRTPFDKERTQSRIVAIINDTAIQLKQSQLLQTKRQKQMEELEDKLEDVNSRWRQASQRLTALRRLPSTEAHEQLRELHRRAGYMEREIEDLGRQSKIFNLIKERSERKAALNAEITRLESRNEELRASQTLQLATAHTAIADEIRKLLRNDLPRQDSFENAESIAFDFGFNRVSVDGHTYFSASSRVILKSSFFVGFLAAATKNRSFKHPRFIMVDSMEDKGMEPARSHNFQNQILRISEESPVDHQIIYATAMISPQLDDPAYTIGKFSTREDRTLNLG